MGLHSFHNRQTGTHFEVVWDEKLGRPEEVEDVAEHVSIPVNEVVLLQAVQDYRLCAIKETTDSTGREGRDVGFRQFIPMFALQEFKTYLLHHLLLLLPSVCFLSSCYKTLKLSNGTAKEISRQGEHWQSNASRPS